MKRRTARLRWVDGGADLDGGIERELLHHVEERIDELTAAGWSEEAARAEAWRALGDGDALRSELRRIGRGRLRQERLRDVVSSLRHDIVYGWQSIRRNASYTNAIVLTVGLAIGVNGALFSVADALLLRPLPYTRPSELVQVFRVTPDNAQGRPYISPAIAGEWLQLQGAVSSAFLTSRQSVTWLGGGEPRRLSAQAVTEAFEETLGVEPVLGRGILPEDARVGAEPVVLLEHGFWLRELAGRTDVLGSRIDLGGVSHAVIGVMPRGFKFPEYASTEFWVPLAVDGVAGGERVPYVEVIGRVAGDLESASAAASQVASLLYRQGDPQSQATFSLRQLDDTRAANPELRAALKVLAGAVGLILLIAGVNMMNLLLLRGAARARELAIRLALGASRFRLARQLAVEAMLLAALSGIVAALLAFAAVRMLVGLMPDAITFFASHAITVETRTVLFTFGLALASGLLFGLLPAVRVTRPGADADLVPRTQPGAGWSGLRRALIVTEVAVAVTLLVAAGLLLATFTRLARQDPGLELDRLAVLAITVSAEDFPSASQRVDYVRAVEEAVAALPGVASTSLTSGLPPRAGMFRFGVIFETEDGAPQPYDGLLPISGIRADFFDVTGARLVAGRSFDRAGAPGSVIIDAALAAHLWPGEDAVGRRFRLGPEDPWLTVVGVSDPLRLLGPDERRARFSMLEPLPAEDVQRAVLAIRATGDPRHILADVRNAVHELNRRQVIEELDTAASLYADSVAMQRFLWLVVATLALLALLLTAVGLHGLLSYGITRRWRELGVRMALGAGAGTLRRMVLAEGLGVAATGIVAGLAGAALATRLIRASLYGVEPGDPVIMVAVACVVLIVAGLSSLLPARRATSVDPAVVLRAD